MLFSEVDAAGICGVFGVEPSNGSLSSSTTPSSVTPIVPPIERRKAS